MTLAADLYHGEYPVDMTPREARRAIDGRMLDMIMSPDDLEVTDADKQAACDLIGTDTYGQPHWTVETISPCNRVVQAFAKHRALCLLRARASSDAGGRR